MFLEENTNDQCHNRGEHVNDYTINVQCHNQGEHVNDYTTNVQCHNQGEHVNDYTTNTVLDIVESDVKHPSL